MLMSWTITVGSAPTQYGLKARQFNYLERHHRYASLMSEVTIRTLVSKRHKFVAV